MKLLRFALCACFYVLVASICLAQSDGKALDALLEEMGWEGIKVEYTLTISTSLTKTELDARWKRVDKYVDHPDRGSIEYMRRLKDHPEVRSMTAWYAGHGAYYFEDMMTSKGGEDGGAGGILRTGGLKGERWMRYRRAERPGQLTIIRSGVAFPIGYNMSQMFDEMRRHLHLLLFRELSIGGEYYEVKANGHMEGFDFPRVVEVVHTSSGRLEKFDVLGFSVVSRSELESHCGIPETEEGVRVADFRESGSESFRLHGDSLMGEWVYAEEGDHFVLLDDEHQVAMETSHREEQSVGTGSTNGRWWAAGIGGIVVLGAIAVMRRTH